MRALRPALAIALALAATQAVAAKRGAQPGFAEPGDIIAAEGNFVRLIAEKGMKAAIRATATPDAQGTMLKKKFSDSTEAVAMTWHTHALWMSCDGSFAVTHGEWQLNPASGWYVMIWQRQKGGDYKWLLAEGGLLEAPLPQSDMIAASIADCPVRRARAGEPTGPDRGKKPPPDYTSGVADDGTLAWATASDPDGSRIFTLRIKRDEGLHEVLRATAPPPGP